jgi:PAS domain S-box-containing protein
METGEDSPVRVLHVDDDGDFLDLVGRLLERTDETIRHEPTEDPETALDRVRAGHVDCVLSDYEMPEMDGLEFLRCVRSHCPNVPFILYTGRGDESVAAEAISAGVDDYVRKGADAAHYLKLSVRIRREVERARAEAERGRQLAALEAAREGICVLDADGRVTYANEAYLELYGYDRASLLGTHWEQLHPEEEVEFITAEVLPHVEAHGEWSGESEGVRADDTTVRESKSVAAAPGGGLVIVVTEFEADPPGQGAAAGAGRTD